MGPLRERSGETGFGRRTRSRLTCFNGAAARTQRRGHVWRRRARGEEGASMGPLRERSGELAPGLSGSRPTNGFNGAAARTQRRDPSATASKRLCSVLQWGRCANAAESLVEMMFSTRRWLLQWGRCANAAESSSGPLAGTLRRTASMGPLRERSGELCQMVQFRRFHLLQWGRCANAAESQVTSISCDRCQTRLQWGRCANAAESTLCG